MKKMRAISGCLDLEGLNEKDFENKAILIFAARCNGTYLSTIEYLKKHNAKNFFVVDLEDLEFSYNDMKIKYPNDTQSNINKTIGTLIRDYDIIIPNYTDLKDVVNYIRVNQNNDFIIGCDAGVSRTGALYMFLKDLGYEITEDSRYKFIPNHVIYYMMKELYENKEPGHYYNKNTKRIGKINAKTNLIDNSDDNDSLLF